MTKEPVILDGIDPTPTPRTDLEWLEAHIDALFQANSNGRLVARNEPGRVSPPRLYLGRTRLGNLWRFRVGEDLVDVRTFARLAALERLLPSAPFERPAPPERLEPLRRTLERAAPIESTWCGPAFCFPADEDARVRFRGLAVGTELVEDEGDRRLEALAAAFERDTATLAAQLPIAVSSDAGAPVALCGVGAGRSDRFAEAGVDTLPSARGRLHGSRCVAAWALAITRCGGHPLYSTQWENRASRGLARKLCLIPFAEDLHFR